MIIEDIVIGRVAAHVTDRLMPRIGVNNFFDMQGVTLLNDEGHAVRRLCYIDLPGSENAQKHAERVRKFLVVLNAGIVMRDAKIATADYFAARAHLETFTAATGNEYAKAEDAVATASKKLLDLLGKAEGL